MSTSKTSTMPCKPSGTLRQTSRKNTATGVVPPKRSAMPRHCERAGSNHPRFMSSNVSCMTEPMTPPALLSAKRRLEPRNSFRRMRCSSLLVTRSVLVMPENSAESCCPPGPLAMPTMLFCSPPSVCASGDCCSFCHCFSALPCRSCMPCVCWSSRAVPSTRLRAMPTRAAASLRLSSAAILSSVCTEYMATRSIESITASGLSSCAPLESSTEWKAGLSRRSAKTLSRLPSTGSTAPRTKTPSSSKRTVSTPATTVSPRARPREGVRRAAGQMLPNTKDCAVSSGKRPSAALRQQV